MHSVNRPGKLLSDFCGPDRMALVVYDMQIGIMRQIEEADGLLSRVASVLNAARSSGLPVIFMRQMSMTLPLMGAFQRRHAMAWQRTDDPAAIRPWLLGGGKPRLRHRSELAPRDDEAILDNTTSSAFEGTPLSIILRDLGLSSFAVCGVTTRTDGVPRSEG